MGQRVGGTQGGRRERQSGRQIRRERERECGTGG